ncbi:phosphohistidine phosphatase SixA [Gilvimarinus sp. DA14]|uniref:phosphohistidine phosphatase SixA n=1 Tax=Gilvimarinus sp. DA14 TaxID=2956798 RepID=UPI0020B8E24B|nr:phosphohistidine phosphatase SixA [Gilvimarinus sp. DA14]UTF61005.1 phosphohistidine phosphatase SixA [Gilvimarinus sp. DA14]
MRLFILRHGQAEPYRRDDESRELVDAGRGEVKAVISRQAHLMGCPAVWGSPYIRAQQTAVIASEILGVPQGVSHTLAQLTPDASPAALIEELYQSGLETLLIVSHQPLVSHLLDTLCGPSEQHGMNTASLACVDCDVMAADMGRLEWLVHP